MGGVLVRLLTTCLLLQVAVFYPFVWSFVVLFLSCRVLCGVVLVVRLCA